MPKILAGKVPNLDKVRAMPRTSCSIARHFQVESLNMENKLSIDNYSQGFLVDDDLMAGVSQNPEKPDQYFAFVLQHTTGEYLGYQPFSNLESALQVINQIERSWVFEKVGGCGGCGKGGQCSKGGCGKAGSCNPKGCDKSSSVPV